MYRLLKLINKPICNVIRFECLKGMSDRVMCSSIFVLGKYHGGHTRLVTNFKTINRYTK